MVDLAWTRDPHRLLWAVWVRWLVIGGFFALAVAAHPLGLFPQMRGCTLAAVAGALMNGVNYRYLRRRHHVLAVTVIAVPLDHLLITYVVASTGGGESPFLMMYTVQAVATALLLDFRAGLWSVVLAGAGFGGLLLLAAAGMVTFGPLFAPGFAGTGGAAASLSGAVWLVFLLYCLALLVFVGGYISARMRRGEEALAESNCQLRETVESLRRARDDLAAAYARLQQTETQLVHVEKMRALGELVAGVAHELNNPLSFVSANVEHLRRYCGRLMAVAEAAEPLAGGAGRRASDERDLEEAMAELPEALADCEEGVRRAKQIVGDLQLFAQGDRSPEMQSVDVTAVVRRTAALLRHRFADRIRIHLQLGAVPEVRGRPGPLAQVFLNLLLNAADAVGGRGNIWVETALESPWEAQPAAVRVRVRDDGPGVAPEHLDRIFDPFFTTKDVGRGTGLGLSVSYGIVRQHGGVLTVSSAPTGGAQFDVLLPIAHATATC